MPHTLRRKMFKLGGEVNSHGVGLTSGLNYNRPGYKKGGDIKKLKTVAAKLQKASKAHKGQSRTLRRIISKYV